MINTAMAYRDRFGYSVIPVKPMDKVPNLINWKPFVERHATDEEISEWFTKWPDANLGIVTGAISGVSVIDIDTPEAETALFEIIPDSIVTVMETTPRGGKHMFFKYDPRITSNSSQCIEHVDTKSDGGMVVVAPSKRKEGKYAWIEGLKPSQIKELATFPEAYIALLKSKPLKVKGADQPAVTEMFSNGRRDEDLFHTALQLAKSHTPEVEIFQILERIVMSWGENDPQWIRTKLNSALDRLSKTEVDISADVRAWIINQIHPFRIESCFRELNLKSSKQMADCRSIAGDMMTQGIIEKGSVGFFRLVDRSLKHIKSKKNDPIEISWPLGLGNIIQVHPHDVVVIAGVTGQGKTAFALNVADRNMKKYFINYIASELREDDIYYKTSYHLKELEVEINKDPSDPTKRVQVVERANDPWDIIIPDALNIIDYIERHDQYWKIAEDIKKCFDKLTTGLCLICLQKNKNAEFAMGGGGTMQKASLVINLESFQATIKKARWWKDSTFNPIEKIIDYEIEHGINMRNTAPWRSSGQ
jgi:hypothetical protein